MAAVACIGLSVVFGDVMPVKAGLFDGFNKGTLRVFAKEGPSAVLDIANKVFVAALPFMKEAAIWCLKNWLPITLTVVFLVSLTFFVTQVLGQSFMEIGIARRIYEKIKEKISDKSNVLVQAFKKSTIFGKNIESLFAIGRGRIGVDTVIVGGGITIFFGFIMLCVWCIPVVFWLGGLGAKNVELCEECKKID